MRLYACCDENRRAHVARADVPLNGIDFLEVEDGDWPEQAFRQRTLLVRMLKPIDPLTAANVRIEGGARIRDVAVDWAEPAASAAAGDRLTDAEKSRLASFAATGPTLVVRTAEAGDFSTYTLRLVAGPTSDQPPPGIDPLLASIAFSFKVECDTEFDCRQAQACPPGEDPDPKIDYLAKDYESFRAMMLDRIAQLSPDWRGSSPADLMVALTETLAYVGDHLSYEQDAIATEATLARARRRASARRHARLVDYAMHDGRAARTFLHLTVDPAHAGAVVIPAESVAALTRRSDLAATTRLGPVNAAERAAVDRAVQAGAIWFEPARPKREDGPAPDLRVHAANNAFDFYTWSDAECCLRKGATRATLVGPTPELRVGDILVFEEVKGPRTGRGADADPQKRCAVRLVQVEPSEDPAGRILPDDTVAAAPVTEIRWHRDDALPFDLCVSSRATDEFGGVGVDGVTRAFGNIVLFDHGRTRRDVALGAAPTPHLRWPPEALDRCDPPISEVVPPRFRPTLPEGPLTQAAPAPDPNAAPPSARALIETALADARPAMTLTSDAGGDAELWDPRRDLLASGPDATDFVVEVEGDGVAQVRFGDDRHGRRPAAGAPFAATFRIGNGPAGNIGADALAHLVIDEDQAPGLGATPIVAVRNPLPGVGGIRPETIEEVRQRAPYAFMVQERAVTEADYADVSERHPQVQKAQGTFRWTGSWRTMFVTADRFDGVPVDAAFKTRLRGHLEPFRMAGYDLEVDAPIAAPLEIELFVCVAADHFREPVKAEILNALSSRRLPDGRRGFFHPDNMTFGDTVYLSAVVAAAQAVPGVASVEVRMFRRWEEPASEARGVGGITCGRREIPRLDNDPSLPENGVLRVETGGGK